MFDTRLHQLPGFAKLFVGIITTLMLLVCLWAVFIYYVEEGMVGDQDKPLYLQDKSKQAQHQEDADDSDTHEQLEENIGLAHTHINGQTLLMFALGLIFLFTSQPSKRKKWTLSVFGVAIVLHAIGLSGRGFYWLFDDILAASGFTILAVMSYISFTIYADLFKSSPRVEDKT
jgi:hypothetical protein